MHGLVIRVGYSCTDTPTMLPELMAYICYIIKVHQDYSGLALVRYDTAFAGKQH